MIPSHLHRPFPRPVLAALSFLLLPHFGVAQSILRTAGDFTLLGGSAISSTPATGTVISHGNVGLSPTGESAITGFGPAVVNFGAVVATGSTTALARSDFLAASAGLAAMTGGTNLTGLDLGGRTLASGVYRFDTTAGLTGALILDAQGQNNAFWVFQIGTSLTTAANAAVTFANLGSNGGSDLGLFWNTGTTVIIGADNIVAGNYLSGSSISLGNHSGGSARALALSAITLDQNTLDAWGGPGGGDLTGGLTFGGGGNVTAIPEPATNTALAALGALALCLYSRRARTSTIRG
ncbi:MAG: ice-binding family protein [Verrucomicrobia bacterium]|nr:ice-binding family protein [Verrucomicrobiota bacterium]